MSAQEQIPQEWVFLKNPHSNVDDSRTASEFCKFIEKFYWRPRDDEPDELLVVFNRSGDKNRYKYIGVPRSVYEEAWKRAHNPGDYDDNFGSWYSSRIRDEYQYKRHD